MKVQRYCLLRGNGDRLFANATSIGGTFLMVKNCTLRTRWDGDDLRTDSQGTQFPASQTGILWPTVGNRERGALPAGRELSGGPVPGEGPNRGRDAGDEAKPPSWALRTGVGAESDRSLVVEELAEGSNLRQRTPDAPALNGGRGLAERG